MAIPEGSRPFLHPLPVSQRPAFREKPAQLAGGCFRGGGTGDLLHVPGKREAVLVSGMLGASHRPCP